MRPRTTLRLLLLLLLSLPAAGCSPGTSTSHSLVESNQGAGPARASSAAPPPTSEAPAETFAESYRVKRVVDGDTVVLLIDGRETKVRLIGVDTPETVHPQKAVEAYGREASDFTKNLLEGESVYLDYEPGSPRLDKYGRTLAYVYRAPDRLFVNLEIIRRGFGHAYTKYPFKHMEEFRSHERAAKEAGKGLWGQGATIVSDAEPATTGDSTPDRSTTRGSARADSQASRRSSAEPSEETREAAVYVTRTGAKYHRDGCRYLSRSQIPISLKDAKANYSACSVCRPPQ